MKIFFSGLCLWSLLQLAIALPPSNSLPENLENGSNIRKRNRPISTLEIEPKPGYEMKYEDLFYFRILFPEVIVSLPIFMLERFNIYEVLYHNGFYNIKKPFKINCSFERFLGFIDHFFASLLDEKGYFKWTLTEEGTTSEYSFNTGKFKGESFAKMSPDQIKEEWKKVKSLLPNNIPPENDLILDPATQKDMWNDAVGRMRFNFERLIRNYNRKGEVTKTDFDIKYFVKFSDETEPSHLEKDIKELDTNFIYVFNIRRIFSFIRCLHRCNYSIEWLDFSMLTVMHVEESNDASKIRYLILGFAHPPILRPTSSSNWTDFEKELKMFLGLPKNLIEMSTAYENIRFSTEILNKLNRIQRKDHDEKTFANIKKILQILTIEKEQV